MAAPGGLERVNKLKQFEHRNKFKQFDCVTDFSDHYYYKPNQNPKLIKCKSTIKKIMREWKILEKHLPESISVRVYEGRIDLLRAVIIGAQKTPYHNGLYFFDFKFPSDYPNNPPSVTYRSFGLRINPNLYKSGYVCLSLLNTWTGRGCERWEPNKSTVLQILNSLQALVLNEKPYFNEPGLKPAWSWESYNADVFVLSCRTMLYLIDNPAKNFEGFVVDHFRVDASFVLRACIDYREGRVMIGFFNGNDEPISPEKKIKVSRKFKNAMEEIYPKLYKAFSGIGATLTDLPEKIGNDEKPADGIIGKFKRFWESVTA